MSEQVVIEILRRVSMRRGTPMAICRRFFVLAFIVNVASAAAQDQSVDRGKTVFLASCDGCHIVGPVDPAVTLTKAGPHLNDLFGRVPGESDHMYSLAMVNFGKKHIWDEATLTAFLREPSKKALEGSNMKFDGVENEGDIKALLAYLATFDKDGIAPK